MAFLAREGARINYEVWGTSGPCLTLVNGHSRTMADFRSFARFMEARGWRVLIFDNRGAGATEVPGPFTLKDCAEDILAMWDEIGVAKSHLLGISYGGTISATTAGLAPERVSSLIMVSTGLRATDVNVHDGPMTPSVLLRYFSPAFAEKHKILVQSMAREMARAFTDERLAEGAKLQRQAMRGFDLTATLEKMTVPALVLHGGQDRIIDVLAGKRIASLLQNSQIELYPEAGHLLLAEMPKRLFEQVAAFCEGVEANAEK